MTREQQLQHHVQLDAMAAKCGERTSHLGCAYCAYLAAYYAKQDRATKGINR